MENPLVVAYYFLQKGGPAMYALFFCSILVFSITAERFYSLWKFHADPDMVLKQLTPMIESGKMDEAAEQLKNMSGVLPLVLQEGISRHALSKEKMETAMADSIVEYTPVLEGMLGALGTIAVIAPFLGLLGTITGLISAFNQIALRGTTGPAVIATGIYEALYTTAAGLVIAIPAVIFYNYFKSRISSIVSGMEIAGNRLVEMITLQKDNTCADKADKFEKTEAQEG